MNVPSAWAVRFWARVDKGGTVPSHRPDLGPCWIWTGSRLPRGYGRFYPKLNVGLYAHRVSWEIANGVAVPAGLDVMHACDNPPCVNPAHLSAVTHRDNELDKWAKGRGRPPPPMPGESNPQSKLTAAQVVEIRALWASGVKGQREIAARFGVSKTLIGNIIRNESWCQ